MNAFMKAMSAAASAMNAQSFRLRISTENVANADTPGYRSKQLSFANSYDRELEMHRVKVREVSLDKSPLEQDYDPANPLADDQGYVTMSNVNITRELADSREANRSYEANLSTFRQARQMYSSLIDVLRR
ncbi:MAG: flagellar basal body rod protein FlgC [Pseudomonadota bacterium]